MKQNYLPGTVRDRIQDQLKERKITQGELAAEIGISESALSLLLLAEWDTMVSHRFAMRAIEHLKLHRNDKLPDKIVLTFIEPEQKEC